MDQQEALQIRRCHCCGGIIESAEEIMKCNHCGKALLPFHYFAKRRTADPADLISVDQNYLGEIERALIDGVGPIRGLTAYW